MLQLSSITLSPAGYGWLRHSKQRYLLQYLNPQWAVLFCFFLSHPGGLFSALDMVILFGFGVVFVKNKIPCESAKLFLFLLCFTSLLYFLIHLDHTISLVHLTYATLRQLSSSSTTDFPPLFVPPEYLELSKIKSMQTPALC